MDEISRIGPSISDWFSIIAVTSRGKQLCAMSKKRTPLGQLSVNVTTKKSTTSNITNITFLALLI